MHLRPSTLFYCAIIAGIATVCCSSSNTGDNLFGHIDIDDDVEGSGIDSEPGSDTEGSASGDYEEPEPPVIPHIPKIHIPIIERQPESPETNQDLEFVTDVQTTTHHQDIIASLEEDHISFFSQPGILAAIIGGALVGLLCAILVVMFIVYRMRKKDEGSYALDERKRSSTPILYGKGDGKELYA